jgi:hypothetical protein
VVGGVSVNGILADAKAIRERLHRDLVDETHVDRRALIVRANRARGTPFPHFQTRNLSARITPHVAPMWPTLRDQAPKVNLSN